MSTDIFSQDYDTYNEIKYHSKLAIQFNPRLRHFIADLLLQKVYNSIRETSETSSSLTKGVWVNYIYFSKEINREVALSWNSKFDELSQHFLEKGNYDTAISIAASTEYLLLNPNNNNVQLSKAQEILNKIVDGLDSNPNQLDQAVKSYFDFVLFWLSPDYLTKGSLNTLPSIEEKFLKIALKHLPNISENDLNNEYSICTPNINFPKWSTSDLKATVEKQLKSCLGNIQLERAEKTALSGNLQQAILDAEKVTASEDASRKASSLAEKWKKDLETINKKKLADQKEQEKQDKLSEISKEKLQIENDIRTIQDTRSRLAAQIQEIMGRMSKRYAQLPKPNGLTWDGRDSQGFLVPQDQLNSRTRGEHVTLLGRKI